MTPENERKKTWLNRYRYLKLQVKHAQEEINELHTITPAPINYSGMPSAHNQTDLSDYMVKYDKAMQRYLNAKYKAINSYNEIIDAINLLPNEKEKTVLKLRYLRGMTMERICTEIEYEWAQTNRIHSEALQHFNIPKDDMK